MAGKVTARGRRLVTTRGRLNAPRPGAQVVRPYGVGDAHGSRTPPTARVNIPVNTVVRGGTSNVTGVTGDVWNNHYFTNDGRTWLEVKNNALTTQTIALEPNPALPTDGLTVDAQIVPVRAGDTAKIGPFTVSTFTRDLAHDIYVDVSSSQLILSAYNMAATSS